MKFIKAEVWDKGYEKETNWLTNQPSSYAKSFKKYLKKKDKILEIGFGRGQDLIYLEKNGFECYGLEISKVAVEKVKKLSQSLHLFLGKAEDLPFKSNSFDAVYCVRTLYHLDEIHAVPEMARVLEKDGILYLCFTNNCKEVGTNKIVIGTDVEKLMGLLKDFNIVKKEIDYNKLSGNKKWLCDFWTLVLRKK